MSKILVTNGEKGELVKLFNTSYPTVRDALNGRSKSILSYKIRQAAIERGGMEQKKI